MISLENVGVTWEFNKYNALTFTFQYGEMNFTYKWDEPYLHNERYWQSYIRNLPVWPHLTIVQGMGKGDESHCRINLPDNLLNCYIKALQQAIKDPRILQPYDSEEEYDTKNDKLLETDGDGYEYDPETMDK